MILPNSWKLWFHDPNDESWAPESYKELFDIKTVEDWIHIHTAFKDLWINGMFWIMLDGYPPIWEHPLNKSGGCYSYKIMKPEIPDAWFQYVAQLLGETITPDASDTPKITGIAITPKRNYCVLRIWITDSCDSSSLKININIPNYTNIMFKAHLDKA